MKHLHAFPNFRVWTVDFFQDRSIASAIHASGRNHIHLSFLLQQFLSWSLNLLSTSFVCISPRADSRPACNPGGCRSPVPLLCCYPVYTQSMLPALEAWSGFPPWVPTFAAALSLPLPKSRRKEGKRKEGNKPALCHRSRQLKTSICAPQTCNFHSSSASLRRAVTRRPLQAQPAIRRLCAGAAGESSAFGRFRFSGFLTVCSLGTSENPPKARLLCRDRAL